MNRDAFLALVSLLAASACARTEARSTPASVVRPAPPEAASGAVDEARCDRFLVAPCDEEARPREVCRGALRGLPAPSRAGFLACAAPRAEDVVLDPACDAAVRACGAREVECEALEARHARCVAPGASGCEALETDVRACRARADAACIYSHECASAVHDACLLTVDALDACLRAARTPPT